MSVTVTFSDPPGVVLPPFAMRPAAQRIYENLGAYTTDDSVSDWQIAKLVNAIVNANSLLFDLAEGTDEFDGDLAAVDPQVAPDGAITWLAMLYGVRFPGWATTLQQKRQLIISQPGRRRGELPSIVSAARRLMTGAGGVLVRERYASINPTVDTPYALRVEIRAALAPMSVRQQIIADVKATIPVGIQVVVDFLDSETWQTAVDEFATWQAANSANSTWQQLVNG